MNICVCLSNLFKKYNENENEIYNKEKKNNDKDINIRSKYPITIYFVNYKHTKTRCSICLETVNSKNEIITKCNHKFHHKCIINWCNINDICPLCRREYPIG